MRETASHATPTNNPVINTGLLSPVEVLGKKLSGALLAALSSLPSPTLKGELVNTSSIALLVALEEVLKPPAGNPDSTPPGLNGKMLI